MAQQGDSDTAISKARDDEVIVNDIKSRDFGRALKSFNGTEVHLP